jgi:hypothetical protein
MALTNTGIDKEYLQKLKLLSDGFGMSNTSFLHAMIDYFDYYKINPMERAESVDTKLAKMEHNLEQRIGKLRDTFVSFIRELEKKKLEPLINQTNESTQALLVFLKEEALTRNDLPMLASKKRKVALLEQAHEEEGTEAVRTNEDVYKEEATDEEPARLKKRANNILDLYRSYFSELIGSVSRKKDNADYILIEAINDFKEKISKIPSLDYSDVDKGENFELIEKIKTIIRTADIYCEEFLMKGEQATGKDKLFFVYVIQEFKQKFNNIKVI